MMSIYKTYLRMFGGYFTKDEEVHLRQVEQFTQYIGAMEDTIFHQHGQWNGHRRAQSTNKQDFCEAW